MEILDLQKRIKKTLELINDAKSISVKRRYFVYLSGLVETYNLLTDSELKIGNLGGKQIMKHTFMESLVKEFNENGDIMQYIGHGILSARHVTNCYFRDRYFIKHYNIKYLKEIFESFLASLSDRHYKIYKDMLANDDIAFNQEFAAGFTIFDYERQKSVMFTSYDEETLPSLLTLAHELGHVYEFDYTKCSRKPYFTTKFNVNIEVFSMFTEGLLLDYLRKIHFDPEEVNKLEEKFYKDVVNYAAILCFTLSLKKFSMDSNYNLIIHDVEEANARVSELIGRYDAEYSVVGSINLQDAVYYTYGGFISTIYRHYYNQDPSFIKEISKHFLDYQSYSTEEILEKLPFVMNELENFSILKKKLSQIKTNQF